MDDRVLAELHLDQVEAKGLDLPDELLQGTIGRTGCPTLGKRPLDDTQVGEELVGVGIHEVCRAREGGLEACRHDEHRGTVRLALRDRQRVVGHDLAHLDLVLPEVEELAGGGRGAHLDREVASDAAGLLRETPHDVQAVLLGDLATHLCRDEGIAVAVRANPAARMEECGADGLGTTGVLAEQPVVEAPVDLWHHVEERGVEDVDDGVGLLHRAGLLPGDGRRAHKGVDLLEHLALVLDELGPAQLRVKLEQVGNATDLALDGLAACLRGMGGEDRMELEAREQFARTVGPALAHELGVGDGELVARVDLCGGLDRPLARAERLDAIALLGDVGQVEEGGEGARHQLGILGRELVDEPHRLLEGLAGGLVVKVVRTNGMGKELVKGRPQARVELVEHLALQAQEEFHAVAQALRDARVCEGRGRHASPSRLTGQRWTKVTGTFVQCA